MTEIGRKMILNFGLQLYSVDKGLSSSKFPQLLSKLWLHFENGIFDMRFFPVQDGSLLLER